MIRHPWAVTLAVMSVIWVGLLWWLSPGSTTGRSADQSPLAVAPAKASTEPAIPAEANLPVPHPLSWPEAHWQIEMADVPIVMPEASVWVEAAQSMAEARLNGDSRTPPILHVSSQLPAASAAQKNDPEAYAQYEADNTRRLYQAYVQAADQAIPQLQQDIARARAAGLSVEQIREGEEKLRRIQAMQQELQQKTSPLPP